MSTRDSVAGDPDLEEPVRMTRSDNSPVPEYPGLLRLDGRRFVVLGAGQGIGRQASHALASVGAATCVRRPGARPGRRHRRRGRRGLRSRATPTTAPTWSACSTTPARALGGDRRRRRHHRHGPLRRHHRAERRGLGLALRHRVAPCLPRDAVRGPRHAGARRRDGVRGVGLGHHVGAETLGVRRREGRAHVARAHRRGRARAARGSG